MLLPRQDARGQVLKQHFDGATWISIFVKLPRRASVMTTFLQACDMQAIKGNLQPGIDPDLLPK